MNISQMLRGIVGSGQQVDAKTLELKIGQVVKGIVLQILAESDAMVNIGGVPIRARLETPLQVGQMTLLQVQPESSTGQVVLKPLGSSNVQILEASLPDLVKSLGMKDTEANRSLVQQLHAAAIPLNAKSIKAFQPIGNMAPASNIPQDQWTEAAIVAHKKGLPLKSEIVLPLQQAIFGKPLPQALEQLQSSLTKLIQAASPQEENSETTVLVRKLIETINGLSSGRVASTAIPLEQADRAPNNPTNSSLMEGKQAPKIMMNGDVVAQSKQGAGATLNIPTGSTPTGATLTPPAAPATVMNQPQAPLATQSTVVQQPSVGTAVGQMPPAGTTGTGVPTPAQSTVLPVTPIATPASAPSIAPSQVTIPGTITVTHVATPITTETASPVISPILSEAAELTDQSTGKQGAKLSGDQPLPQGANSQTVGNDDDPWIKQLLKQLGVDHEHRAVNLFTHSTEAPDLEELQFRHESVKGLLLQLTSSDQLPNSLKETAQQLVQQITGQQLLLGAERGSPFSLVTLFVPIQHENGTDTASVHIQSKRKQGGNLDPDNCRLLFDLRMSTLGDTLLDVHVVDRIVSLQIHNDYPMIGNLLESLKPEIEASMKQIGFQFISMKNVPYPDPTAGRSGDTPSSTDARSAVSTTYHSKPYKGVDFRV